MKKEKNISTTLGFGLGLRQKHVNEIIKTRPTQVDWFEIISENYLNPHSEKRKEVENIRQDYPFVMHGVSMSIGSSDEINIEYLTKLKELANWLQPKLISDHICWTGINNFNSHDLLPVAYTEESLKNMIRKVSQVQDFLGRRIALENPSTYLEFKGSTLNEWDYIKYVAEEADCNLLLDVNNVYVNCYNHGYNAKEYISQLPKERIVQIHLAGHKNLNTHIIDTHDAHITDEVLDLYSFTISRFGFRNSMIEWDADIPEFDVLLSELQKVKEAAAKTIEHKMPVREVEKGKKRREENFSSLLNKFQNTLHNPLNPQFERESWIKDKDNLTHKAQMDIYSSAYRIRLFDLILAEYKASSQYLGEENFKKLVRTYIEYNPSKFYNIDDYIAALPEFTFKYVDDISQELIILESEIFKLQEVESGSANASETLSFNHDVNKIYSACINDYLGTLKAEEIKDRPINIILTKEMDGVYRKLADKEEQNKKITTG